MVKNDLSASEIIGKYLDSLKIIEKSNLEGEYKIGNKEGKKIIKLFKGLEQNHEQALEVLSQLITNESVKVRICAAAHCLSLNILLNQAIKTLEEIASLKIRIFSFEAEMTLKVYREQGYLKVYPAQKI